tara:strand:+ start:202 stop:591 length:390 start_codon:yes stop_codon:yes gene_type:complete
MNLVVIGIGSNIRPEANIARAWEMITRSQSVLRESPFVETYPVGYKNQPNFINGAILIETGLDPTKLKELLIGIEHDLGRNRRVPKDCPRTIDLDIVIWNGTVDDDVRQRDFLRDAVREVLPELIISPP